MKNKTTKELQDLLQSGNEDTLDTIFENMSDNTFVNYIHTLMIQKDITKSVLIEKSNLHRTYAYQIFNGKRQPSRDKVLQIAIALQCNLEECNRLLTLSKHHILYVKNRRDSVLIFAITQQLTLLETEQYLQEYHQPLLIQYDTL